jgi:hypothetical protein
VEPIQLLDLVEKQGSRDGTPLMASRSMGCFCICCFFLLSFDASSSVVASAQKNIAKIGGLFKRKKSVTQQQDELVASKPTEQSGSLSLKKTISNKDTHGFQKLADE